MKLPKFLQPYLASYDLVKLEGLKEGVKKEVISEVLNSGNTESVKWIFTNYDIRDIKHILLNPMKGSWLPMSLNYWTKIFDINLPKEKYNTALINLNR